jgi:hypothetical protein
MSDARFCFGAIRIWLEEVVRACAERPGQIGAERPQPNSHLSPIRKGLDKFISPKRKLTKPIKKPKATWVEPKFFAEVKYRDITPRDCCAPGMRPRGS